MPRCQSLKVALLMLAAAVACCAFILLAPHARAATAFSVYSGTQTASGQGGAIPTTTAKEMVACVSVTAISGTAPAFSAWLQTSPDGGTTWYDLPADAALLTAQSTAADQSTTSPSGGTGKRNILTCAATCSSPQLACGQFSRFGSPIRAAWTLAGAGASVTFSVNATGK